MNVQRLNERTTVTDLGNGLKEWVFVRGQNYFDRDVQAYLPTPVDLIADDRSPGFSHVSKGHAWKRVGRGGKHRVGFAQGQDVTYSPIDAAAVEPEFDGNTALYRELWPDVDVRLTPFPEGIKEDLILKSRAAAASYAWFVQARAAILNDAGEYIDPLQSTVVGRLAGATIHDAAGEPGPLSLICAGDQVTLELDRAWMDDPTRVYPVTVDPTTITIEMTNTAEHYDTYVDYANPTTGYGGAATMLVGDDTTASGHRLSIYVHPDIATIPTDQSIQTATLRLYNQTTTAGSINLTTRLVTAAWAENITYNTRPTDTTAGEIATTVDNIAGYKSFDVTAFARGWCSGQPNDGVAILKVGSSGTADAHTFSSSESASNRPQLAVVTVAAPAPGLPYSADSVAPTGVNNALPVTLSGTYASADGIDQQSFRFLVSDDAGAVWDSGTVAGTDNTAEVGAALNYGKTYTVAFSVTDTLGKTITVTGYIRMQPAAPANLAVTPDAVHAKIGLAWDVSPSVDLFGYRVYRRDAGTPDWACIASVTGATYTDKAIGASIVYEYAVTAISTGGYESPKSAAVSGSAAFTGSWLGDIQVLLAEDLVMDPGVIVTQWIDVLGKAHVTEEQGPRGLTATIYYRSLAERASILAQSGLVSYRDDLNRALQGRRSSATEGGGQKKVEGQVWGTLVICITEVAADV